MTDNYNIPSNNRELQHDLLWELLLNHYNIPSNNRELQLLSTLLLLMRIITYQVITGNYSIHVFNTSAKVIITYQVITGNYSSLYLLQMIK